MKQGSLTLRKLTTLLFLGIVQLSVAQTPPPTALKVLHEFSAAEGTGPAGALIQGPDGSLYGVMSSGGALGQGSIFKFSSSGQFETLHSFGATGTPAGSSPDGANPSAGLIFGADGNLYGTTSQGGPNYGGTVFRITTAGQLTTLFAFGGAPPAGSQPFGRLSLGPDGSIYGTTYAGGLGVGTVFKLSSSGTLISLHNFPSDYSEGGGAIGPLAVLPDGTIYGTTNLGGFPSHAGNGTIFKINPDGTFALVHYFPFYTASPVFGLTAGSDGVLYGAAELGAGDGSLFSITGDGLFNDLYDFRCSCGTPDGAQPDGPLTLATDGNLYGVTSFGGTSNSGTIFRSTTDGVVTPLHSFTAAEGGPPTGGLLEGADGRFYGMTSGAFTTHPPVIYSLALPPSLSATNISAVSSDGVVNLTWVAVKGASNYSVYQGTGPGAETPASSQIGLTDLRATVSGLQNGTIYYFKVVATNEAGDGPASEEISAMPVAAPTNLKATVQNDSITLSWSAAAGASGYSIFQGNVPAGESTGPIVTGVTGTTVSVTGLAYGTKYYFKVASVNGSTTVMSTEEVSGAIAASPAVTTATGGKSGGGGKIDGFLATLLALLALRSTVVRLRRMRWSRVAIVGVSVLSVTGCGGGGSGGDTTDTSSRTLYSIGGTVSGLADGASIVLQNNGGDSITVNSNTSFTFPTAVATGGQYGVTVATQSPRQTCSVKDGQGVVGAANVSTIGIVCAPARYQVGGTISGLAPGTTVVLNNNGTDPTSVNANGAFASASSIVSGSDYSITIATQPEGQTCSVSNGDGTISAANVETVKIVCAPTLYTISGTVSGLAQGASIVLQNNGTDSVSLSTNSTFAFPTAIANGGHFNVTIATQPLYQTCNLENASGTIAGASVINVVVHCPYVAVVWVFGYGEDGADPWAGLIRAHDGSYYGTTQYGGADIGGTVFKFTPRPSEKYSPLGDAVTITNFAFSSGPGPEGAVVQGNDGNLYGTTYTGGSHDAGSVFKVSTSGTKSVLWSFGNGPDGSNSRSALIQGSDGNFYGTTTGGGGFGGGTVFKITPSGVESVLWSFGGNADGRYPQAGVVQGRDGNLYGTTSLGGPEDRGIVFKLSLSGTETVLFNFDYTNGTLPESGLIQATDGMFYGTASGGGTFGGGTLFRITPAGLLTVLWNFGAGHDGAAPNSGVVQGRDGNLYGTTAIGGTINGDGTIFRVTLDGVETVLWDFGYGGNGNAATPFNLIEDEDGNFYGTTWTGGTPAKGTIFKLIF